MIISYSWLKELVDVPISPTELAEVMTFLGLEVEQMTNYVPGLDKVVIGEIVECEQVAGSDHLFITRTNVGGETVPMICGAPNTRVGLKVAVMLPGAVTAEGMIVKKAKLRGHESHGMIVSERELGLSDDHTGIIEGDAAWRVGAPAADYLNLPDTIYDVEVTPNRPDFLSLVGVARDLAAKFCIPWRWPEHRLAEDKEPSAQHISIEICAPQACPRYAGRVVKGVKIQPSPYELRLKLARCGTRPISNIVDVTNLLMLEYGHPLHAFDMRFLEDSKIVVRLAAVGETFVTLDGKEHKLSENDLLIADGRKGVALAGIMGGLNSEIREDTTDVLIECAYFDPVHVRRTAHMLGIGTESSRRFERGVDPNGILRVIDATAALMQELGGGRALSGCVDAYPNKIEPKRISFRPARATHVVGVEFKESEIANIFERLGCEVESENVLWQVKAPTFRPDLEREIDLIEEVIRVHGYDAIPTTEVSRVSLRGHEDPLVALRCKIVDVMVALGFHETLSLSMYAPDPRRDPPDMPPGVALKNPVTDDMPVMQGSLFPQLVRSAAGNWQRGDRNLRLFEVARVFHEGKPDDPRTWERQTLAAIITGHSYPESWSHPSKNLDFYDLKAALNVLCAKISLDNFEIICYDIETGEVLKGELLAAGPSVGKWGIWPASEMAKREIDAPVAWFELDIGCVEPLRRTELKYVPFPRFPISWRDIAVVVDESVSAAQLLAIIRDKGGAYLIEAEPFDLFRGDKLGAQKKSLAIRLEFSHPERSLESAEVDQWVASIVEGLHAALGAELR
jgi:phenylalanyl-tRNA synthetase beta chain